jgi:hypothetical protein
VVSLWPGVFVNRATHGQVWLGVPFGDAGFVPAELHRQLMQHDARLRAIAAYASAATASGMHRGVSLVRQNALQLLRYSANARDVHFLRSLSPGAVRAGAELHDHGVEHTLGVVLGQAPPPSSRQSVRGYVRAGGERADPVLPQVGGASAAGDRGCQHAALGDVLSGSSRGDVGAGVVVVAAALWRPAGVRVSGARGHRNRLVYRCPTVPRWRARWRRAAGQAGPASQAGVFRAHAAMPAMRTGAPGWPPADFAR